jgi:protoporphyrinogen oxidase
MHIAVIGAGPAGLTAACQLSKGAHDVSVFESADCVGGMARSFKLWGQTVDVGPHRFFSKDRLVNEIWLEAVGTDYAMVKRLTRILYNGRLFKYPLEATDALGKLGLSEAIHCLASYGAEMVSPTRMDGSFEDWVRSRFGQRLFEIFFKSYSEKLWGISCKELDADFAAQRIKKFSLAAAIKGALLPATKKKHRTLVDEFAYPTGGTGMAYERMAEMIRHRGKEVHLNTPVRRVLVERGAVVGIELASGARLNCGQVISTMPLTTLVKQLDDVPREVLDACARLKFRNTILVYLEVLGENPFPDNWIYVHSSNLKFGRVTNFGNWVPQLRGSSPNTILALEYWCNFDDALWSQPDSDLIVMARREIVQSGLVSSGEKLGRGFVFRVPKCYPIYRRGYQDSLGILKDYLASISGLQVVGRYGAFKYNNQDHSILMGHMAAENVQALKHNLWTVNADYETYQEESSITQTGLVKTG